MESHGEPGRIHVSEDFMYEAQRELANQEKQQIHALPSPLQFHERGTMEVKGKGLMRTFFLD
jgi:hypothetical protein